MSKSTARVTRPKSSTSKSNPVNKGRPAGKEKQLQDEIDKLKTQNQMLRRNLDPKKIEEDVRKANEGVEQFDMVSELQKHIRHIHYKIKEEESGSDTSREEHEKTIKKQKELNDKIQKDLISDLKQEKQKNWMLEQDFKDVHTKLEEKREDIKTKEGIIQTLQSSSDGDKKNEKVLKAKDLEISALKEQLEKLKSVYVTRLKQETEKLKKENTAQTAQISQKDTIIDNLKKQLQEAQILAEVRGKDIAANSALKAPKPSEENLSQKLEQLHSMIKGRESAIKEEKELIGKIQKDLNNSLYGEKKKYKELEKDFKDVQTKLEEKEEIIKNKERLIQTLQSSTDEDTAISKVADPNITDLSDENRPTKLSEKYADLYDNDWVDAYEEIENEFQNEQEVIKHLLRRLLDIFTFCQKTSEEYAISLKSCALSLPRAESGRPMSAKIGVTNMRQLRELRRSFSPHLVETVFQHFVKIKKLDLKKKPKTEKFIRECVRICWLMSSQDPPVIFDTANVKGAFDGDRFRTYTKTGKTVDFVVWPPMLLHQNGPMLCKGVAQGK